MPKRSGRRCTIATPPSPSFWCCPCETSKEPNERAFDPQRCNDTNRAELHVLAHPSGHVILMAILDNLGKGASGTAIQALNLMLGVPESTGLPA
ncbi:MAG: hypothetical protein ABSA52_14025 [Candidatus Binatia bacterium]|jgi:N-acetyl-gamma-glutamyl-phosphate reductase